MMITNDMIKIYMNNYEFSFLDRLKDSELFIFRDPYNTFLKTTSGRTYEKILDRKIRSGAYFRNQLK